MPNQLCIYEITLTSYIEQSMNSTMIVDLIFDLHRDFINPKVIARRQITRLIDRLLTKVAPELILNRKFENKENASDNTAQQQTPAKVIPPRLEQDTKNVKHGGSSGSRHNLGLQLN